MDKLFELRVVRKPGTDDEYPSRWKQVLEVKYNYTSDAALDRGDMRLHYLREIDNPEWEEVPTEDL